MSPFYWFILIVGTLLSATVGLVWYWKLLPAIGDHVRANLTNYVTGFCLVATAMLSCD